MRRGPRTRARRREGVGRPPLDSASVQPPIRANGTLPRGSSGSLPFRYYPVHLILWDSPSQRRRRSTRRRTPPAPKSVDTATFDLGNRRRKAPSATPGDGGRRRRPRFGRSGRTRPNSPTPGGRRGIFHGPAGAPLPPGRRSGGVPDPSDRGRRSRRRGSAIALPGGTDRPRVGPVHVLHIAHQADWHRALEEGTYRVSTRGRTLDEVGYIHAFYFEQVQAVARAVYADDPEALCVLVLDEALITDAGVRLELE